MNAIRPPGGRRLRGFSTTDGPEITVAAVVLNATTILEFAAEC
jgi:hypothetical protein